MWSQIQGGHPSVISRWVLVLLGLGLGLLTGADVLAQRGELSPAASNGGPADLRPMVLLKVVSVGLPSRFIAELESALTRDVGWRVSLDLVPGVTCEDLLPRERGLRPEPDGFLCLTYAPGDLRLVALARRGFREWARGDQSQRFEVKGPDLTNMATTLASGLGRLIAGWSPAGATFVEVPTDPQDIEKTRFFGLGQVSIGGGPFQRFSPEAPLDVAPSGEEQAIVVQLDECSDPFVGRLRLSPATVYKFRCDIGPVHHLRVSTDTPETLVTLHGARGHLSSHTLRTPDEVAYFGVGVEEGWTVTCERVGHVRWEQTLSLHRDAVRGRLLSVECTLIPLENVVVVSSAIPGVRFKVAEFDAPLRRLEGQEIVNGPGRANLETTPGQRHWLALPAHARRTDAAIWARAAGFQQRQYVVPGARPLAQPFEIHAILHSASSPTPLAAADVDLLLQGDLRTGRERTEPDSGRPWLWVATSMAALTAGAGGIALYLGREDAIANAKAFRRGSLTEEAAYSRDADARDLQETGTITLAAGTVLATALFSYLLATGD